MRRLKDMSIEDLLDREQDLHTSINEGESSALYELIDVEEELYRKISSVKESEYATSLEMIKRSLISNLVHYGTYLKTVYQKDDNAAENTLRKALRYDRKNPVANYRLGFLAYKRQDYIKSISRFQNALQYQKTSEDTTYSLTPQQIYNANLYLSSSALYIAKQAQEASEKMEGDINKQTISNLEMSPLYEMISQNEEYLRSHAFTVTSQTGTKMCSKDDCEKIIDSHLPGTIILYFSDREHSVFYNSKEVSLSINQAEMLKYLMLHSTEEVPAIKNYFASIFQLRKDTEIPDNTYIKAVGRLRRKLAAIHVPDTVIANKKFRDEFGYYYDQTVPFMLIQRTDDI